MKIQKQNWGGGGVRSGLGGQGGCERRIEVFVKIQKKWGGGGGQVGGTGWGGGQVGCEQRIEVIVKNKKKSFFLGGGEGSGREVGFGGWVRVDATEK